ncbi:MAG: MATE family efflux transporter [Candidatus Thermoplasmatota archaeon]|nr:MATE family efflux transporter [Candidatus Thermoplasmatota archaeon]
MANNIGMAGLGFVFWRLVIWLYSDSYGPAASEEMIGIAASLISAATLIGTFSILGFDISLVRHLPGLSEADKKRTVFTSLFFSGVVGLIISSLSVALAFWLFPDLLIIESYFIYIIFIIFSVFWSLFVVINGVFMEGERGGLVFVKNVILFSGGKLLLPFFLVAFGAAGIFLSWGLSMSIAFFVSFCLILLMYRSKTSRPRILMSSLKSIATFSVMNHIANILSLLPSLLLPIIVLVITDANQAAYVYIAWMIASITFMIPHSVSLAMFASCSNLSQKTNERAKQSLSLSLLILLPLVLVAIIFSDMILEFMGSNFSQASAVLSMLVLSALPITGIAIITAIKRVQGNMKEVVTANFAIFCISVSLWILLLGERGISIVGEAWLLANTAALLLLLCTCKLREGG